ncbi:MAG: M1 family metallopeptidase, partial [Ignavibacteria bacterium]|nr:M1 family metallopeptidase [Ignavibacteria bacterium]
MVIRNIKYIFGILIYLYSLNLFAQEKLFIPRNFLDAYKNKTRSLDGKPGEKYWQNHSDYKIKVSVNPKTRDLNGDETITYFNNSPDTLKQIVIRLYHDIYRKGVQRNFDMSESNLTDGVKILSLDIDGLSCHLSNQRKYFRNGTNLFLNLDTNQFVLPKSKVKFRIQWNLILPSGPSIRMGTYDSTSFFIAYWYPQIAVYDDIDGWDKFSYLGDQEFYNDFNNYEVEISVPKDFCVWATGVLQNPNEVLSEKHFSRYEQALNSNEIVKIIAKADLVLGGVTRQNSNGNIWKYKADYVPDFAFGMSDHYLWDASSLEVEPGRSILISAVYKESSKDFYDVASAARKIINSLSNDFPGVPFPYPRMTVFNGAGGMEFPMMVNDASTQSYAAMFGLTSHEITHTYFPFYMGINERKYAWMDEGWAVMLPYDIQTEIDSANDPRSKNAQSYARFAGLENDMPMMIPATLLRGDSYRMASYSRPACAYDLLRDILGKDIFDNALREYMRRWNG